MYAMCNDVGVSLSRCISVLSFHPVGPEDRTQVLSLGCSCLYPLSHLVNPLTYKILIVKVIGTC